MTAGTTIERWTTSDLPWLQKTASNAEAIARLRIQLAAQGGFAACFVNLLNEIVTNWFDSSDVLLEQTTMPPATDRHVPKNRLYDATETKSLQHVLQIHVSISQLDATLAEEVGYQGSHRTLSRIAEYDAMIWNEEEDQDCIMELQDMVCEIAARAGGFPFKVSAFSRNDIVARLPLQFEFNDDETDVGTILIQQVNARQSAQHDVGFVMWPSAVALARWIVMHADVVQRQKVLELGAGCGLVGLVAAKIKSRDSSDDGHVILTDFNQTVLENARRNIRLNHVGEVAAATRLDFYQQTGTRDSWTDMDGNQHDPVDLVLAADIICQPDDAIAAAKCIHDLLVAGRGRAVVVCADSCHRYGVDHFETACRHTGLEVETSVVNADLYKGMTLTTGYVKGMLLLMFDIRRPKQLIRFGKQTDAVLR